ncbi:MAG: hypothetical protein ACRDL0_20910 [Thermoleophilaceae bacterium]
MLATATVTLLTTSLRHPIEDDPSTPANEGVHNSVREVVFRIGRVGFYSRVCCRGRWRTTRARFVDEAGGVSTATTRRPC